MSSRGLPVVRYDPSSIGARAYRDLAEEVRSRIPGEDLQANAWGVEPAREVVVSERGEPGAGLADTQREKVVVVPEPVAAAALRSGRWPFGKRKGGGR